MKKSAQIRIINPREQNEARNPLLPIFSVKSENISDKWELKPHQHPEAQLLFSIKGTMICEVKGSIRIVPPQCAVWIPTNLIHSTRGNGNTECCCIFIDTTRIRGLPDECVILSVSPLLRELILFASYFDEKIQRSEEDQRIFNVLVDQIKVSTNLDVTLPMPSEPRLYSITNELIMRPNNSMKLKEWAHKVNMSERSFTRLVQHELGMSFGRWKQQLHVIIALQRISKGESITSIALDLGYENASGFVTMFKKILGKPPLSYFRETKGISAEKNGIYKFR